MSVSALTKDEITRVLAYAGLVLLGFELIKALIVKPIKAFYTNVEFGPGMPFKSYAEDVKVRHKDEFEACLLYLRDFMQAIDADGMDAIQAFRKHRNILAHDLPGHLNTLNVDDCAPLLEGARAALFKLSNYRTYMEIGADPEFKDRGIDWDTVVALNTFLSPRFARSSNPSASQRELSATWLGCYQVAAVTSASSSVRPAIPVSVAICVML